MKGDKKNMRTTTYRGYWKNRKRKLNPKLVNGRVASNMSFLKTEEYKKLWYYIYFHDINPYGYAIATERLYKNLKYRKRYIKLIQSNKNI